MNLAANVRQRLSKPVYTLPAGTDFDTPVRRNTYLENLMEGTPALPAVMRNWSPKMKRKTRRSKRTEKKRKTRRRK
jgi:hypothetical protein